MFLSHTHTQTHTRAYRDSMSLHGVFKCCRKAILEELKLRGNFLREEVPQRRNVTGEHQYLVSAIRVPERSMAASSTLLSSSEEFIRERNVDPVVTLTS